MFKCASCGLERSDGVKCSICKQHYDLQCSGLTEGESWKCTNCQTKPAGSRDAEQDSMVRQFMGLMKQAQTINISLSAERNDTEFKASIKEELAELRRSKESSSAKLEDLERSVSEVSMLKIKLSKLEKELNDKDQWFRRNNVEIKGIPFTVGEELFKIIENLCARLSFDINTHYLNFFGRVDSRETLDGPIIISFVSRFAKEEFLAKANLPENRNIIPEDINVWGRNRIYINDHLTVPYKLLLNEAKRLAKRKNYNYVWVKNARIFVRKDRESRVIAINSEDDLKEIR